MITRTLYASIRGLPHNPAITEINVRTGPGTNHEVAFRAAVGLADLPVLAVQPDAERMLFQGKLYQWLRVRFPDAREGWVRDDLLAIRGDGVAFGYEVYAEPVFAFDQRRRDVIPRGAEIHPEEMPAPRADAPAPPAPASGPAPAPAPAPIPAPPAGPAPAPAPTVGEAERVRTAAFNITAAFEGGGYATFQNYDAGIISDGRVQFTRAGSGLFSVLDRYTSRSDSPVAQELRTAYLARVRQHDPGLRHDGRLRGLLIAAAADPIMQAAQDEAATVHYWDVVQDLSIRPRGIRTALGQALIFDMGINFGPRHSFITAAEQALGVPPRTRVGENGATEPQLIRKLADLRRDSHYRQAARDNLPGLKARGDFWVDLCARGDWDLQGDADGLLLVKPGARVRVR